MPDSAPPRLDPAATDETSANARRGARKRRDPATAAPVMAQAGHTRREVMLGELHLRLLEQYGPPSVVVNDVHEIVHLSQTAGRYLQFVGGEPSANITRVVLPPLQIELRTVLFKAAHTKENARGAPVRVEIGGETETIALEVRPMSAKNDAAGFYLVLFAKAGAAPPPTPAAAPAAATLSREADEEIQFLKQQLATTVEQYEVANEELTTINHELKANVEELSRINADLDHLMASTNVGTVFLDRQLRIHRFTPAAQKIFNLLPADMGRPISDITSRLHYAGFRDDVQKVLADLHTIEREVTVSDGNDCYLTRIAPYRTGENGIAGVVATFIDITRRKRAEAELLEGEARYRSIFNSIDEGYFLCEVIFDEDDVPVDMLYLAANPAATRMVGQDFTGKRLREIDPGYEQYWFEVFGRVAKTGKSERQERYAAPTQSWYDFFVTKVGDAGDGRIGVVFQEITARKRDEAILRFVAEITGELSRRSSAAEIMEAVGAKIGSYLHVATCNFVEVNDKSPDVLRLISQWSRPELSSLVGHHPLAPSFGEELQRACRDGEVVVISDTKNDPRTDAPFFAERQVLSCVHVPFHQDGAWKYLMSITDTRPRKWRADEIELFTELANRVLPRLERTRAEEALRASEERFRTIADNVPQVIWTNDSEGNAVYFNRQWYDYTGLSREESTGAGWQAVVHPHDAPASVARWQQAFRQGEIYETEYRLRGRDGEYRWFLGRNVPLRENDAVLSWFGTATDIDDVKQAEAALRETEERFRLLVEGTPDYAMFLMDQESIITYWSKGAERVFGWTADEAVGQTAALIFTPEDRAKKADEKEIEIALRDGRTPDRRWHLRNDERRIWVDGVMHRLDYPDTGSLRGFAKIARDATEQRNTEEALRHARDEMEQRVVERTADLLTSKNEVEQAMALRQELEKELLEISEREKRRVGEDLHDMVCQELTATALFLKTKAKILEHDSPPASQTLSEAAQIVNRNVGLARDLARGLQPAELGSVGLTEALRDLATYTTANHELKCRLKTPRTIRIKDQTIGLNLYRIAQEAVTNAIKHAQAKEVVICLERIGGTIRLTIEDDGKGMRRGRTKKGKGLGVHIMHYRANVLGGHLEIEPREKGGTKITCEVPVKG
ncbi:hypothetical protein BH20VER2_BH20VER2_09400 [soil metagenome]